MERIRKNARYFRKRYLDLYRYKLARDGRLTIPAGDLDALDDQLYLLRAPGKIEPLFAATMAKLQGTHPESRDRIRALRELGIVAYYLGWTHLGSGRTDAAKSVLDKLEPLYEPYAESAPPELRLALSRYYWLKSGYLLDIKDFNGREDARRRALGYVEKLDLFSHDYLLAIRMKAGILWSYTAANDKPKRDEACEIYQLLSIVRPSAQRGQAGLAYCQIAFARQRTGIRASREAVAFLEAVNDELDAIVKATPALSLDLAFSKIALLNAIGAAELNFSNPGPSRKLEAALRFNELLAGNPVGESYAATVRDSYIGFSDIRDSAFSGAALPVGKKISRAELFAGVADAVEASRKASPQSANLAYVALDSRLKAVAAHEGAGNLTAALAASDTAMAVFGESAIIPKLTAFNEDAALDCDFLKQRIDLLLRDNRLKDAAQSYTIMERGCGAWVRKYPWDIFARTPFVTASMALGRAYHVRRNFNAAVPLLAYASNWGSKDATLLLADMYRAGRGVKRDDVRSKALHALGTRQAFKRFTIPVQFGGSRASRYVWVHQYGEGARCKPPKSPTDPWPACVGFDGIDDQVVWFQQSQAGTVPADVVSSFRKLDEIAQKNNVSLPELAVYALDAANSQTATKTPPKPTGAPPKPAPLPPEKLTTLPPLVKETRFYTFDDKAKTYQEIETRVVPRIDGRSCIRWRIGVTPERRKVEIRSVIDYPTAPKFLPVSDTSKVENDGKRWVRTRQVSLSSGQLAEAACLDSGDPLGLLSLEVFVGNTSLYAVKFEVVRDDGLFEWFAAEREKDAKAAAAKAAAAKPPSTPTPPVPSPPATKP